MRHGRHPGGTVTSRPTRPVAVLAASPDGSSEIAGEGPALRHTVPAFLVRSRGKPAVEVVEDRFDGWSQLVGDLVLALALDRKSVV